MVLAMTPALGGCGEDDADAGTDPVGGADVESEAADPAADEEAAGPADEGFDCNDAYGTFLELDQSYRYAVRQGTPDGPIDFAQAADDLTAAVEDVPDDGQDEYEAYAGLVVPFFIGLDSIGWDASDPGGNDADAYVGVTQQLDGAAVDQARTAVQQWLTGQCEAG